MKERKEKKYKYLQGARKNLKLYNIEINKNGDTMKSRDILYNVIKLYDYYYNDLKGKTTKDFKTYQYLKELYYDDLIFTPTIEDLKEMKYWI